MRHEAEFNPFWSDSLSIRFWTRAIKMTDEYRKELGKHSREKYGVGFCPFHGFGLDYLSGFEPNSFTLTLDGKRRKFHMLDCGQSRYCNSIISFEEELLEELSKKDLKRVVSPEHSPRTLCPACGSDKGKVYDTGIRVPGFHEILIEDEPLYLFERPCHIYAAATTEDVLLYPITRRRPIKGKIHLATQR